MLSLEEAFSHKPNRNVEQNMSSRKVNRWKGKSDYHISFFVKFILESTWEWNMASSLDPAWGASKRNSKPYKVHLFIATIFQKASSTAYNLQRDSHHVSLFVE